MAVSRKSSAANPDARSPTRPALGLEQLAGDDEPKLAEAPV
ncbi:hypothetical protein OG203_06750 [Nocardia sp. NBC_01499]